LAIGGGCQTSTELPLSTGRAREELASPESVFGFETKEKEQLTAHFMTLKASH
jgi:hypothetical protein